MIYASNKVNLVTKCEIGKVFEVDDCEDFTEEWIQSKLAFFK